MGRRGQVALSLELLYIESRGRVRNVTDNRGEGWMFSCSYAYHPDGKRTKKNSVQVGGKKDNKDVITVVERDGETSSRILDLSKYPSFRHMTESREVLPCSINR
jgi:hypothetical protein